MVEYANCALYKHFPSLHMVYCSKAGYDRVIFNRIAEENTQWGLRSDSAQEGKVNVIGFEI